MKIAACHTQMASVINDSLDTQPTVVMESTCGIEGSCPGSGCPAAPANTEPGGGCSGCSGHCINSCLNASMPFVRPPLGKPVMCGGWVGAVAWAFGTDVGTRGGLMFEGTLPSIIMGGGPGVAGAPCILSGSCAGFCEDPADPVDAGEATRPELCAA